MTTQPRRKYPMHARLNLWTDDEHATLVSMAKAKATMGQVAAELGRTRNAVAGHAKKFGISFVGGAYKGGQRKAAGSNIIKFPKAPKAPRAPRADAPPKPQPILRVVTHNVDLMVKDYLAKHGARRFESGFSTDYWPLKNYLGERGIELTLVKNAPHVSRGRGRPRKCTWNEIFAMADTFRVAEGLTPILRGSAA